MTRPIYSLLYDATLAARPRVEAGLKKLLGEAMRRAHARRASARTRHVAAVVAICAVIKEEHLVKRHVGLLLQCWKVLPALGARIDLPKVDEVGHALLTLPTRIDW